MLCKILGRTVLVLAACAPLAPLAAADEAAVQGVWLKHERRVDYVGFTSLYSCDGLEDKLRLLLKAAGARDDIKIHTSCSNPFAGPSRIADAEVAFYALAPAAAAATAAGAAPPEPGVGVWKAVEFSEQRPYWLDPGDCELVEQFDLFLVELFLWI